MEASGSVSDPNNWQQRYLTGDVPWDKGGAAPPLTEFLTTEKMNGHVLVPGCGPGHDVRAIAKTGAQVVGLDFAAEAIVIAKSFPAAGTEQYLIGDFFQLPPEQQTAYDWVYEHTCFCAIDPKRRVEYVASVASALKSDGKFLAIFYLDPDYDGGPPYGVEVSELDALFNGAFELEREWKPKQCFPGREGREIVRILRKR